MAEPTQLDIQKLTTAIQDMTKKVSAFGSAAHAANKPGEQKRAMASKPGERAGVGTGKRFSKDIEAELKEMRKYSKLQRKDYALLHADAFALGRSLEKLRDGMDENLKDYVKSSKELRNHAKALTEIEELPNRLQDKLVDSITSTMKSSGITKAFASSDIGGRMREIDQVGEDITTSLEHISSIIEKSGAKSLSSLNNDDMIRVNETLREKGLATAGVFDKINDVMSREAISTTKNFDMLSEQGMKEIVEHLKKAGIAVDDITKDISTAGKDLTQQMQGRVSAGEKLNKALAGGNSQLLAAVKSNADFGKSIDKQITGYKLLGDVQGIATNAFKRLSGMTEITLIGSLTALAGAAWAVTKQFLSVANLGLAGNFGSIYTSAYKMGVSFDTMQQIFTQSRRELTQFGTDGLNKMLGSTQDQLRKFGLDTETSAKASVAFAQATRDAGAIVGSKEFENTMAFQVKMWEKMNAVTGISAEEFARLNGELLNNADTQKYLLSFGRQERQNKVQEMMLTRQWVTQMTGNAQAAQQVFQALQGLQQSKFQDRYDASMRMQQQAGIVGMGAEGQELGELMLKRNKTDKDNERIATLSAKVAQATESLKNIGPGMESAMDTMEDDMPAAAKSLLEAGTKLQIAADAQRGVTDKQVKNTVDTTTSEADNKFLKIIQSMQGLYNVISGPILTGILAIGSAVGILALNGGGLGKILTGALGAGKSLLSGLAGAGSTATGALAGGASTAGKLAGGAKALALPAAIAGAIGATFDGLMGKFGIGKDDQGNDIQTDKDQDDANWARMSAWEKTQSAIPRAIEKVGSFAFLGNMANQAAQDRIASETAYLNNKDNPQNAVATPTMAPTSDVGTSKVQTPVQLGVAPGDTTNGVNKTSDTNASTSDKTTPLDNVLEQLKLILAQLQLMTGLDEQQLKALLESKEQLVNGNSKAPFTPFSGLVPTKESFLRTI